MTAGTWTERYINLDPKIKPLTMQEDEDTRDRIWLSWISAGKEDALNELYLAYGQRLYAFALRLTDDPALAEDVVQETLLTVWHDAARYRGQGRVIAWLLGILHYRALNSLRNRRKTSSFDFAETLIANEPSPEESLQAADERSWLRSGLDQLSREHREVLELVFYQKLTLEETAKVVGCPIGTVKSRLSYARKQLRGELERSAAGKEREA